MKYGMPIGKLSFSKNSNIIREERTKEVAAILAHFDSKHKEEVAAVHCQENAFMVLQQRLKAHFHLEDTSPHRAHSIYFCLRFLLLTK